MELSKRHKPMSKPPSIVLKEGYVKLAGEKPTSDYFHQMAQETLFSPHEVEMWFDYLRVISDNRKQAAVKVAETRKRKRALQQQSRQEHSQFHRAEVAELAELHEAQAAQ